jgi:hypothetical protein
MLGRRWVGPRSGCSGHGTRHKHILQLRTDALICCFKWFTVICGRKSSPVRRTVHVLMPNTGQVNVCACCVVVCEHEFHLFQGSESLPASAVCWPRIFPRKWSSPASWVDVQSEQWLGVSTETLAAVPYRRQSKHLFETRKWVLQMLCFFVLSLFSLCASWISFFSEKLTDPKLVKFPSLYGTRRFVTAFTRTCPYPKPDEPSPSPHPTSLRSILILSSHLRLGLSSGPFLRF